MSEKIRRKVLIVSSDDILCLLVSKLSDCLGVCDERISISSHPSLKDGWLVTAPKDSRSEHRFCVVRRPTVYPSSLADLDKQIAKLGRRIVPIVSSRTFSSAVIQGFRDRGWSYLDDAGNCFLRSGQLLVCCEGRALPKSQSLQLGQVLKLTSREARFVIRCLCEPSFQERSFSHRKLEDACSGEVSRGFVWKLVSCLIDRGYVEDLGRGNGYRLVRPIDLISDVASAYADSSDLEIVEYDYQPSTSGIGKDLDACEKEVGALALTGFSATSKTELDLKRLVVRVHSNDREHIENYLNLGEPEGEGSLRVMYAPDRFALLNRYHNATFGCSCVGLLQIYFDLHCFGSDGIEAARELMEDRIRPAIEKAGSG